MFIIYTSLTDEKKDVYVVETILCKQHKYEPLLIKTIDKIKGTSIKISVITI